MRLWILSDPSLGFCVHGGRSSGETRWLDKHTVAWRAAKVHSSLDSPVVFTYARVKYTKIILITKLKKNKLCLALWWTNYVLTTVFLNYTFIMKHNIYICIWVNSLKGLTHCHVQLYTNPDPFSKLHPSDIVDCSSPLPHPHLLPRSHPVRKLSYRGALIPAGVP